MVLLATTISRMVGSLTQRCKRLRYQPPDLRAREQNERLVELDKRTAGSIKTSGFVFYLLQQRVLVELCTFVPKEKGSNS